MWKSVPSVIVVTSQLALACAVNADTIHVPGDEVTDVLIGSVEPLAQ